MQQVDAGHAVECNVENQAGRVIGAAARKKCLGGGIALRAKAVGTQQAPDRTANPAIVIDDRDESRGDDHPQSVGRSSEGRQTARKAASASTVWASRRSRMAICARQASRLRRSVWSDPAPNI